MKRFIFAVILTLSLGLFVFTARADIRPHALCAEGMVLQQQTEAKLWGTADTDEVVTVTFRGKQASATAGEGGRWVVAIPAGEAGGPFEMTIVGKNTLSYKNVLVGEVWLCSGQSNMAWSFGQMGGAERASVKSEPRNPQLRMFRSPAGTWLEAKPETIDDFYAVAYFFGRSLQEARKVPVGLIQASVPGSPIQTWLSPSVLESLGGTYPVSCYTNLIQPILNCRIRGVIWYQGEGNEDAGSSYKYRTFLPALISSWRAAFDLPELAFHIVQLPAYHPASAPFSGWSEVREAQTLTALLTPRTGLAVITDFGDENDIHPKPKRPVGERLALAARGITYGEKIVYSGPMIRTVTFDGPKAILRFDHVGGGLISQELAATTNSAGQKTAWRVRDNSTNRVPLVGFALCGKDRAFYDAQAEIVGDTVLVSSRNVSAPVAVNYAATDHPLGNLFNREGLPASPFRTDRLAAMLTLSAGQGGAVSPSNEVLLTQGVVFQITAASAPNHVFKDWTVLSGSPEFADHRAAATTVRVTDDSAIRIRANFSLRVTCAVTNLATPALVKAGAKVKLAATASILQGSSTVQKVEFFRNDVKIGEAASKPYACTWSDVPVGNYAVTARATDSTGLMATSAPVVVVATASGAWEGIHAEGGTVAYYVEGGTNWTAHIFTNSGALSVKTAGEVEYLVVAGGGGGGGGYNGGGGGAGGVRVGHTNMAAGEYMIAIGAGGPGANVLGDGIAGSNGLPSSIVLVGFGILATGGGRGRSESPTYDAGAGGSGGGDMFATGGKTVAGGELGNPGGGGSQLGPGGGGGAGSVGGQGSRGLGVRADAGSGTQLTFSGMSVEYAKGGLGCPNGRSPKADGANGEAHTGSGGGGGGGNGAPQSGYVNKGGNGGSGIVIVRYVTGGK